MKNIKIIDDLKSEFKMWGWEWETCMEGGRPLHVDNPTYYFNKDEVTSIEDTLLLTMNYNPKGISWWNNDYSEKIIYTPDYSCGLIKSIDTVQCNSVIEADLMFPKGENLWPSFWLTACDSWPPEIDIVEAYSNNCGSYKGNLKFELKWPFLYRELRFESCIHYKGDKDEHLSIDAVGVHPSIINKPVEENWNKFKCFYTDSYVGIFINDVLVREIHDSYIMSKLKTKGMYVIFNIWPRTNKEANHDTYFPFKIRNFKVTKI